MGLDQCQDFALPFGELFHGGFPSTLYLLLYPVTVNVYRVFGFVKALDQSFPRSGLLRRWLSGQNEQNKKQRALGLL